MSRPKKILIVKLSSMGDIVHALPVAAALKSKFQDAFIGWAVEESFKDLPASAPFIDRLYVFKTKKWRRDFTKFNNVREMSQALKEIRDYGFDIAIDAQGLIKSGVVTYLSGAPQRIGFSGRNAREPLSALFYNRRIVPPGDAVHIIDQNLNLIHDFIAVTGAIEPRLYVSDSDETWAIGEMNRMGISAGDLKILISPGAGWQTKIWNPDKYKSLIAELNEKYQAKVILSGGLHDEGLIEEIVSGLHITIPKLTGCSIRQMMAFLRVVNLVIGGDSGPVHIASALGTPTLSLYGPSSAARSAPRGETHESVQCRTECSPCFNRRCPLKNSGKADAIAPCMESISLDAVKAKLEKILDRAASYSL